MMNAKDRNEEKYMVPAVEQAARVLFCLAGNSASQMSLPEICSQVGIHKSKAYSILQTMQRFGLVQRYGDRKGYALGPGLITLSRKVLDDFDAPRLAAPLLEELATGIGGTATLGLIADRTVYVVAKHEGGVDVGVTVRIGHRFPVSYGSHGKAIAASLPPEELDRFLEENKLYFHGTPERFDRERLQHELADCRRDGFALDLGEMKPGLNSVAAPVLGPGGAPIGYIALFGFFPAEAARKFGPSVAAAVKVLSRQLGAQVD